MGMPLDTDLNMDWRLADLPAYIELVERQARALRTREISYQMRRLGRTLANLLSIAGWRVDRFLFPPQLPIR